MTRRELLRSVRLGAAGLLAAGSLPRLAWARKSPPRPEHRVLADLHNHAVMDEWVRLTPVAKKFPLTARVILSAANPSGIGWADSDRYLVKVCGTHRHIAMGSDFGGFITPPNDSLRGKSISVLRDALQEEFRDVDVVEDIMADDAIRFLLENRRSGV